MSKKFTNYKLGTLTDFITGEQRALTDPMNDPVKLNFKFFIDFKKDSGLFADESNVNSALAYLKRIGQEARYNLLKKWIANFKNIIENYEHLFLSIEGLDGIQNAKPYQNFGEEDDRINLKIYEPIDFKIQSLITTYRHIVFDDVRCVEVLPTNLQRFNSTVFVFNHGYYNDLLYGENSNDSVNNIERLIFPTKEKITQNKFSAMNHMVFKIEKCKIDVTESGKDFLSNLENQMSSEFVVNNFNFRFKMASYTARFNHLYGEFDLDSILALDSIQKNYENSLTTLEEKIDYKKLMKNELFNYNRLKTAIKERRKIIDNSFQQLKSPEFKKQLIKSASDVIHDYALNKIDILNDINAGITRLGDAITNLNPIQNIKNFTNLKNSEFNVNQNLRRNSTNGAEVNNNIQYGESNVYSGGL